MALNGYVENEKCKAEIIKVFEKFGVPDYDENRDNSGLDCIYYEFYSGTIHRNRGIGIHIRNDRTGELGDGFDYYSHISQGIESVICLDVIALVYKGEVIYQNDSVITKNLNKIKDNAGRDDWNRRILNARDNKTGRINIPMVMKEGKVRYPKGMKLTKGSGVKTVNITIPAKYVYDGRNSCNIEGDFYFIRLPDQLMINGMSINNQAMMVREVNFKNGFAEITFPADKMLTLTNGFNKIKVSAADLNKALHDKYVEMEQKNQTYFEDERSL